MMSLRNQAYALVAAALAALLPSVANGAPQPKEKYLDGAVATATVAVRNRAGVLIGEGQLRQVGRDIILTLDATILTPGTYAVTLNNSGKCRNGDPSGTGSALDVSDSVWAMGPKPGFFPISINAITTYGRMEQYLRDRDIAALLQGDGTSLVVSAIAPASAGAPADGAPAERLACGTWIRD